MASKKSSRNAMKKIDKQLDKLLKEKKEIEDIPIVDRREIEKKAKEVKTKKNVNKKNTTKSTSVKKNTTKNSSVKKNNRKSDAIVVQERKKSPAKKKEAIVVKERKTKPVKKKPVQKKEAPKKVQKKQKVGESTMRLQKLEDEIRTLYDKVEDVVEDIESTKEVDVIADNNIVITDVIVKDKNEVEEEPYDKGGHILNIIALILFIIFLILFLVFVGFIIFVCTY